MIHFVIKATTIGNTNGRYIKKLKSSITHLLLHFMILFK